MRLPRLAGLSKPLRRPGLGHHRLLLPDAGLLRHQQDWLGARALPRPGLRLHLLPLLQLLAQHLPSACHPARAHPQERPVHRPLPPPQGRDKPFPQAQLHHPGPGLRLLSVHHAAGLPRLSIRQPLGRADGVQDPDPDRRHHRHLGAVPTRRPAPDAGGEDAFGPHLARLVRRRHGHRGHLSGRHHLRPLRHLAL